MISTEGNTRALHFSPAPAGPDFFTPQGPGFGPELGFSLFLYFRHPSISDERNCSAGGHETV